MASIDRPYKWLLLPIENYVREFYGKLLLSAVAAERGWATIMGYKGYVRHHLPKMRGVAIEINMTNEGRIEQYVRHGWRVSAWDEEGLIYLNADEYCRRRTDEAAIRNMDCLFLWGQNQRDDLAGRIQGVGNKLILSGNPRADLLRPDLRKFYAPRAEEIGRAQGKYILINTNFGYVNHYFGSDYISRTLTDQGRIASAQQAADQRAREEHQAAIMQSFMEMLPLICRQYPKQKIIIRPHPSEDFDTWRSAAMALPNVEMIHEGDAVPWLLGAEVVIHNSCTTGVQAYLLDRPVIAYMPVRSDKYDQYLPNALSSKATTADELLALIGKAIADPSLLRESKVQERRLVAQKYISSLDGPWAADRIMDEVDKLKIEPQPADAALSSALGLDRRRIPLNPKEGVRTALRRVRDGLSAAKSPRAEGARTWETYRRQRFPEIRFDEMRADLQQLQGVTGRFANVRLYHTTNDLVCVLPQAI